MTRDARIIAARQLGEANDERIQGLARDGIVIPDVGFIAAKLEALARLVLDSDGIADLELAYQERIAHDLDEAEGPAREAQRRAVLLHDVSQTAGRKTTNGGRT